MQEDNEVYCPFCGGASTLVIDSYQVSHVFVTDCEVCCRPFNVHVECEAGEVVSIEVTHA